MEEGEKVELTKDGMKEKFREVLEEAERLIGETGYHRRDGELAELKKWGTIYPNDSETYNFPRRI